MGIKSWCLKICHVLNCAQQANQQILTCSNLTKEALEKGQKYADTRTASVKSFWCFYC